ncbi:formate dehydrogenase ['Osedax' symbiont bacterium Rs2_46_30_T18]|nr:formate dehydrogenase ['Osedax' symbiont bacterium Rs2_46_30_T18]
MTTTIYLPRDTTTLSLDGEQVATNLAIAAARTGTDIKLVRNGSRGMFWLEPLLEVQTDHGRIAFGPVQPEDIDSLFDADFANANFDTPSAQQHPLYLGLTEEIPYLKKQQRLSFARAGVIDPIDIDDYIKHDGFKGLAKSLQLSAQAIVDEIKDSGLRGRGGAAFPTGIKWQTVLNCPPQQKYIVCNADEGDSGTFADRLLMEADPLSLVEGMTIAALAVGATQGYIYLRSEYPQAHIILNEAIANAYANNFLGDNLCGSDRSFHLEVRLGAGAYICGEETSLLESLEGKRGLVRSKPPLPAIEGLFGQPTVVNNVLSFGAVPHILSDGAKVYADYGMGRSKGTLPFQIAGNVNRGGLVELAFGTSLQQLLNDFAEGTVSGRPMHSIQVGGPLGAYLTPEQWQTPLDYESFAAIGAVLGHGGIVVFDDTVDLAEQASFSMEFCVEESCGKCTPCRIGSVRGVEVIEKIRNGDNPEQNLELLDDLCETMIDMSLCAMGGMTPFPVQSAMKAYRAQLSDQQQSVKGH